MSAKWETSKTVVIDRYSGCSSTDTVAVMPNIVGVMSGIVVFHESSSIDIIYIFKMS